MIQKHYGWVPDVPDFRDHLYTVTKPVLLPTLVDLRSKCPPVYDQGDLGSCSAQAIAAAIEFERKKQGLTPDFVPSRLFIYWNERDMEGTVSSDSGAMLRDGLKSVASLGACSEDDWPYIIDYFAERPSPNCYADAIKDKVLKYQRMMRSQVILRQCLASGYPFVLGISIYESFESDAVASTGVVPMPTTTEALLGGHAVMAVGYDHSKQTFLLRNSWGEDWGMGGYFTLPYAYMVNPDLTDDLWTIRLVSQE